MPGVRQKRAGAGGWDWRERLIFVIVCALGGAAINVLVAWLCWYNPTGRLSPAVAVQTRPWPAWAGSGWPAPGSTACSRTLTTSFSLTSSEERARLVSGGLAPAVMWACWTTGLPRRSMQVEYWTDNRPRPPAMTARGELRPPRWIRRPWWAAFQGIPGRPIPVGFAVNTLVYGVLVGVVALLPGRVRRARRRRRGVCEWCGYPPGVAGVCSECGATLSGAGSRSGV